MTAGRLEAFSDGVMAIAITLLVLDLKVPHDVGDVSLTLALARQWPSYVAYAVSFAVIGIMWIDHHALLTRTRAVDRGLLLANLFLLTVIAALPFTTALFAEHVREPGWDGHVAAAVYSASMLAAAIGFNVVARSALGPGPLGRFAIGLAVYSAAVALSFVSAPLTLGLHGAIAVYYVFDQLPVQREDQTCTEAS